MGFDDLARHMQARDGGKLSTSTDPNLMMVEAGERAQTQQRLRDLVLGPLLLIGGVLVLTLWLSVDLSRLDPVLRRSGWAGMALVVGAMGSGGRRTMRAVFGDRGATAASHARDA